MTATTTSRASRTEAPGDLVAEHLRAIAAFAGARRSAALPLIARGQSREACMDLRRRRDVLDVEHRALLERLDDPSARAERLRAGRPTALVAHRDPWFAERLSDALRSQHVDVLASTTTGPVAVGWAVADLPDVIVVGEVLEMLSGQEVVAQLREYCPRAVLAAQVQTSGGVGPMLDAGADCVHVPAVRPPAVADQIAALLRARG